MLRLTTGTVAGLAVIAAATMSASAQETKITIGGGPYLDVPQITQAIDKNLWKKHGLAAKAIPFRTGRAAFEALIGGQLDFALMAEFPAVIGAMRGLKFGVLAEMSQYRAGRIISNEKVDLKSIKALAGHKIGTTIGTNVHFMLSDLLKKAGVTAEIVNVAPPDIVSALVRGDVNAAAMFPSFYGGAKRALGDRYREFRISNYRTRFVCRRHRDAAFPTRARCPGSRYWHLMLEWEKLVKSDPGYSQMAVDRVTKGRYKMDSIKAAWSNYHDRIHRSRFTCST